jgi:FkbM family methyltransferase
MVPHWKFSVLCRVRKHRNQPLARLLFGHLLRRYETATQPIPAKVHGYNVLLNPGNNYPFIIQDAPFFNAPLVELVFQAYSAKGGSVRFVDVGAATGDTVLLIKQRCPKMINEFICIEGDDEFHQLLAHNMKQFEDVRIEKVILSREPTKIRALVKHHRGSATSIGDTFVPALPLDDVIGAARYEPIDILKIDVDGFDGAVLSGAKSILVKDRPAVIFEWHPKLVTAAGNQPAEAFSVLDSCGYKRFLWFNNVGTFNHFSNGTFPDVIKKAADYLLKVNHRADEHFDVIALPESSGIDEISLAAMDYARPH